MREKAALKIERFGSPRDVLWMKLSHRPDDPPFVMGHGGSRQGFVMIDRGDYWQCGYVVRKGSFDDVKAGGLDAFRWLSLRSRRYRRNVWTKCGCGMMFMCSAHA